MQKGALQDLKRQGLPHQEEDIFRLNTPVAEIRNHLTPVEVITEKGEKLTCDTLILAVPSGTMGRIKFGALSEGKRLVLENMLDSWCVRMTMVFTTPFWREFNYSGNVNFAHGYLMN